MDCANLGQAWTSFNEGACKISTTVIDEGKKREVSGFAFDMRKYRIDLIPAKAGEKYFSDEAKEYDYTANEIIGQTSTDGVVVSSIGFPRFPGDRISRGLLQTQGYTHSEISLNKEAVKYLTAVLCFDERKNADKISVTAPLVYFVGGYDPNSIGWSKRTCDNAIQVGPRIIEKAQEPLVKKDIRGQAENRVTLSIGSDYYVYLLFWQKMSLKKVQDILLSKTIGKTIGKTLSPLWAVNISLRDLAGITTKGGHVGETESTNAAFIVFSPKL